MTFKSGGGSRVIVYRGQRSYSRTGFWGLMVLVLEDGLTYRLRLKDDTGYLPFETGHLGKGPDHLAFAILAHHLGDPGQAAKLCRPFKHHVIAGLKGEQWDLTHDQVQQGIAAITAAGKTGRRPLPDPGYRIELQGPMGAVLEGERVEPDVGSRGAPCEHSALQPPSKASGRESAG